jgi:NAD(P)-dependent dehydrogenase (short-subunit alcohol dehydrogenase family)
VADKALAALGGIDILVNNAGAVLRMDSRRGKKSRRRNGSTASADVGAAIRLTRKMIPGMQERGWGRVINISVPAVRRPPGTCSTTVRQGGRG